MSRFYSTMKIIKKLEELKKFIPLSETDFIHAQETVMKTGYPLAVSASFVNLILHSISEKAPEGNEFSLTKNALLRQILPSTEEQNNPEYFTLDPLKEQDPIFFPPGHDTPRLQNSRLLHKYQGRALLLVSPRCFGNCRFCFRRHTFRSDTETECNHAELNSCTKTQKNENLHASFFTELSQISQNTTLSEIILSGGDPLTLSDDALIQLIKNLSEIPHIRRIRIHTRATVFAPERISSHFLSALKEISSSTGKLIFFVLHINHPSELHSPAGNAALSEMLDHGFPLLQQGVLLRGVNDNLETLVALYENLISRRIIPYYLHQLDRVIGAAHFEVDENVGQELIMKLKTVLPGYAIPRYVREIPGMPAKIEISSQNHFLESFSY